ncbi:MAG: hypothetical protein ABIS51_19425 [Sphingomonas sp.]
MTEWSVGDALSMVLLLGFFGYLIWAYRQRRRLAKGVPDGPPDEPYRVYTRDHDLVLPAHEVPATLGADIFLRVKGWTLRDQAIWHRKVQAAREMAAGIGSDEATSLRAAFARTVPEEWAICLLVDHSGSMRDDSILHTAAAVRWMSGLLGEVGAHVALLGFSTVGWQGGKARQDWLFAGQPKRPGRLCALLHIVYQQFDAALAEEDWETMLHPDILRENVDGEAILWASAMLKARPERHKLLVVLSDGASVDDATLMHNGGSYLERHLLSVIRDIEDTDAVMLGAVGIIYRVERYYRRSRSTEKLTDLPESLSSLIAQTIDETVETR